MQDSFWEQPLSKHCQLSQALTRRAEEDPVAFRKTDLQVLLCFAGLHDFCLICSILSADTESSDCAILIQTVEKRPLNASLVPPNSLCSSPVGLLNSPALSFITAYVHICIWPWTCTLGRCWVVWGLEEAHPHQNPSSGLPAISVLPARTDRNEITFTRAWTIQACALYRTGTQHSPHLMMYSM